MASIPYRTYGYRRAVSLSLADNAGLYPALLSTNESIGEQMLTVHLMQTQGFFFLSLSLFLPLSFSPTCREGNYVLLKEVPWR